MVSQLPSHTSPLQSPPPLSLATMSSAQNILQMAAARRGCGRRWRAAAALTTLLSTKACVRRARVESLGGGGEKKDLDESMREKQKKYISIRGYYVYNLREKKKESVFQGTISAPSHPHIYTPPPHIR